MKKILLYIILAFLSLNTFSQKESEKFIVVIDPGHGGYDVGTQTVNKIYEKEINLLVSKFIKLHIEKYAPEIEIILTRENDKFIALKKRPLYAKITKANLFISVHCNHNKKTYAKGLEIYIQKTQKIDSNMNLKKAKKFALILDHIIKKKLNFNSKGIKYKNLSVLRNSINYVPSVLIELGYFSNSNDTNYITSKKGIDGIALAISKAIINYYKL